MSNTLPTDRYPSSRYPGPRVSTRGKRWGFTIAGLLAGLVVAFVLFQNNSAPIESEVLAFEIIDDSTIDIQLKVTRTIRPRMPSASSGRGRRTAARPDGARSSSRRPIRRRSC